VRSKAQPGAVRKAIEEEIRTGELQAHLLLTTGETPCLINAITESGKYWKRHFSTASGCHGNTERSKLYTVI
jgi:hypothetical protein